MRAIYGYVLHQAGIKAKGVVELPRFFCAKDTWLLLDGMAIIWEDAKGIRQKGDQWATYGFEIDNTLAPMVVSFESRGVEHD